MSLTSKIVRRYLSKAVSEQLQREFDDWKKSGVPAGEYVRGRLPSVAAAFEDGDLSGVADRVRTGTVSFQDLTRRRSRSATSSERAVELAERAERARQRVTTLEEARTGLADRESELDKVRREAALRVDSIVESAREQTELKIETARRRLADIEDRAALHVEDVEQKARLVERSIVSTAEASYAQASARLASDLDRARLEARSLTNQAELAAAKAEQDAETTRAAAEAAHAQQERHASRGASIVDSIKSVAEDRARQARTGRRSEGAALLDDVDLESMSRDDLYSMARDRELLGRSKMDKNELVAALRAR